MNYQSATNIAKYDKGREMNILLDIVIFSKIFKENIKSMNTE